MKKKGKKDQKVEREREEGTEGEQTERSSSLSCVPASLLVRPRAAGLLPLQPLHSLQTLLCEAWERQPGMGKIPSRAKVFSLEADFIIEQNERHLKEL